MVAMFHYQYLATQIYNYNFHITCIYMYAIAIFTT